jgi:uncharacterized protein (DUF433 family)
VKPERKPLFSIWYILNAKEDTVDYSKIITIDPGKRSGKACIRDLRITVYDVLDYLAAGMSQEEILADFPDLTEIDIRACLAFAADTERRFEIVSL